MKRMKVLLVNKFFFLKGGAETSFFDTAEVLTKKGHEVIFFSMAHPANFESTYAKYFVSRVDFENTGSWLQQIEASLRILYSWEARENLDELLKAEKPDIVHLHNIHHQISPSILHTLKKYNLPTVMTLHDYKMVCPSWYLAIRNKPCERCAKGKYYHSVLTKCHKNSLTKSTLVCLESYLHHKILKSYQNICTFICPSKFLIRKIMEMGFRGNLIYLPNFVMADRIQPVYKSENKSVVYFGRISSEKGLRTLIRAVKSLPIKLQILGSGLIMKDLINVTEKEKISNVEFLGYLKRENLWEKIGNSMFTICPSEWYENNPISVLESFACGKPVIGSRIGGIPELVKENETGFLFNPGDMNELREKIECLLKTPENIIRMGMNARKLVESELSPEKHYCRLIEIYEGTIESKK